MAVKRTKYIVLIPVLSPGVGRNTFLSSPHLCFIIVFICDLFVSRDTCLYFGSAIMLVIYFVNFR